MKLKTKEQQESYENTKICYICKEKFENRYVRNKKYFQVKDHFYHTDKYLGTRHSICNLKYRLPKKISADFHNTSFNYNYHFVIKELAEEFKKQFTCLGENTEPLQFQ